MACVLNAGPSAPHLLILLLGPVKASQQPIFVTLQLLGCRLNALVIVISAAVTQHDHRAAGLTLADQKDLLQSFSQQFQLLT